MFSLVESFNSGAVPIKDLQGIALLIMMPSSHHMYSLGKPYTLTNYRFLYYFSICELRTFQKNEDNLCMHEQSKLIFLRPMHYKFYFQAQKLSPIV